MATINKYVNENINIVDIIKKVFVQRIYINENINIYENINVNIPSLNTEQIACNVNNYQYCLHTSEQPQCFIYSINFPESVLNLKQNEKCSKQLLSYNLTNISNFLLLNSNKNINSTLANTSTFYINFFNYKNTIHTSTTKFEFNLGLIIREIKIPVTLTSTYDEDLTLTNITSDFGLGIELENINVGYILPSHNSLSFYFKVTMEGKDIIDNNYLYFHFNNGLIIRWKWCFKRQLSIMYYMFPNKRSYTEKFYYFSKTFRALGGREDVIPFVDIPKQAFSASYSFLPISIKNYLLNLSYKNEYDENLYPMWSEFTVPTSTQTDTNMLYVEKISEFIKEGSLIALIDKYNEENYSILQVIHVVSSENKLELNNKVDYYQDRTLIVPLIDVIINSDTNLRYYNVKDTNITLNVRTLK